MKRALLVFSSTVLFVATLVPTAARADGGGNGTGCGTTMCKPQPTFITISAIPTAANTDGGGNGTSCGNTMCKP